MPSPSLGNPFLGAGEGVTRPWKLICRGWPAPTKASAPGNGFSGAGYSTRPWKKVFLAVKTSNGCAKGFYPCPKNTLCSSNYRFSRVIINHGRRQCSTSQGSPSYIWWNSMFSDRKPIYTRIGPFLLISSIQQLSQISIIIRVVDSSLTKKNAINNVEKENIAGTIGNSWSYARCSFCIRPVSVVSVIIVQ